MPADAPVGSKRPAPETARAGPARAPAAGPPPPPGSSAKKPRASPGDASAAPGAMAGRAPSRPARYLLRVQYDGTNFHGFQRQAKARTVQGCVEDALSRFVGGEKKGDDDASVASGVLTHGSSRTDAGVHALDATMHVDLTRVSRRTPSLTPKPFEAHAVMSATNHFLRRAGANDARVWACARVCPETFHARYSATARTYVYRLRVSPAHRPPSVFEKGKVWHVVRDEPLDVNAMREAARLLTGARDFSSFRARGCQAKSAARTVDALDVEVDDALANAFDPEYTRTDERFSLPEEVLVREETNREETNGGSGDELKKKKKLRLLRRRHGARAVVPVPPGALDGRDARGGGRRGYDPRGRTRAPREEGRVFRAADGAGVRLVPGARALRRLAQVGRAARRGVRRVTTMRFRFCFCSYIQNYYL